MSRVQLAPKYSGETTNVVFDFTSRLGVSETISSAATVATVYSGVDASPSAMVSGSASISGTQVTQLITAGVTGVVYNLQCTVVTSLGQTLQQQGFLAVLPTTT